MSHTCSSALVRCIDFRLGPAIRDYMNEKGLYGDIDIISVAGAVKGMVAEENGFVEGQIDLSHSLHSTNTVILMNHTDCGGYGGRDAFASAEEEKEHHLSEMRKAKDKILAKYPEMNVKLALASISEGGEVNIEEIE